MLTGAGPSSATRRVRRSSADCPAPLLLRGAGAGAGGALLLGAPQQRRGIGRRRLVAEEIEFLPQPLPLPGRLAFRLLCQLRLALYLQQDRQGKRFLKAVDQEVPAHEK
jgi:hypothetical protein